VDLYFSFEELNFFFMLFFLLLPKSSGGASLKLSSAETEG
jgi:hypothetical protein